MIILQAPYDAPAFSIILKNPEIGDNLVLDTRSTFYKAADGTTYGYKKTVAMKRHRLQFIDLTRRTALEVLAFCANAAGSFVKYTDREGQTWRGLIITDPVEVTTTGPGRGPEGERHEANEVVIEYEGVLIV